MSEIALKDRLYRVSDMPPPPTVHVKLVWGGWQGIGARGFVNGRERWVAFAKGGRMEQLPPAACCDRDGQPLPGMERPDLWAPQHPERWQLSLPEPVTLATQQMWSARQSFNAVEEAEAAELASEMEHDRAAAQAHREDGGVETQKRRQWWRDGTLAAYADPGKITKRHAEARIMRSLAFGGGELATTGLGMHRGRRLTLEEAQADLLTIEAVTVYFEPLPQDFADELTAMAWFSALRIESEQQATVLDWAADARTLSWGEIAQHMKIKRPTAAALYRRAIENIWEIANGGLRPGVVQQRRQLDAVRVANRAAKRGSAAW